MRVNLQPFKRLKSQEVEFQPGINLLVGANGSGKSSLLEYLFKTDLQGKLKIAYSSGINESFTSLYAPILKASIRKAQKSYFEYEGSLIDGSQTVEQDTVFYFDKSWAAFLIVSAAFLRSGNKATAYWLDTLNLKIQRLSFNQKFAPAYRRRLKDTQGEVEKGKLEFGFESSRIHKFIASISNHELVGDSPIQRVEIPRQDVDPTFVGENRLCTEISNFFFEKNVFVDMKENTTKTSGAVEFFKLLQVATSGRSPLIPLRDVELEFLSSGGQKIKLNDLSDGEFQLLTTAALVDLFDGPQSLFLLDEIDAHIHPKIIGSIWKTLDSSAGVLLSSSHNMMSLSLTDINRIRFLEDGTILSEFKKKKGVIDSLYGAYFSAPVANSLFYSCKNIFIFDGLADWEIFKALCVKSGKNFGAIEADSVYVAKSSNSNRNNGLDDLISPKMDWIREFIRALQTLDLDEKSIRLKNFFIISDRDDVEAERNLALWYRKETISGAKGYTAKVHKFIWNRRCIENYLISAKARMAFADEITEPIIRDKWKVPVDRIAVQPDRFKRNYMGELKNVGDFFTESEAFNNQSVCVANCKKVVHSFVFDESGLNLQKLTAYIEQMAPTDIDPYLMRVFEKIAEQVSS